MCAVHRTKKELLTDVSGTPKKKNRRKHVEGEKLHKIVQFFFYKKFIEKHLKFNEKALHAFFFLFISV